MKVLLHSEKSPVCSQLTFYFLTRLLQNGNITNPSNATLPICKLFTLYFQNRPYPMFLPQLGFAAIINNLRSQVPNTADDVQALRSALETVGFNVKCYDDCNVQVKFKFFHSRGIFFRYIFYYFTISPQYENATLPSLCIYEKLDYLLNFM